MGASGLLPLVGRDAVLGDIGAVLDRARGGRGALALITGEPGIGKTRLAEEAASGADGFRVVWVWCGSPARRGGQRRPRNAGHRH